MTSGATTSPSETSPTRSLSPRQRAAYQEIIRRGIRLDKDGGRAQDGTLAALAEVRNYDWSAVARANQLPPPPPWSYWLILAGRGFGKTRTGAEQVRAWARDYSYVNLIGATADDARDIMIEGESGLLAVCPERERPQYKKSERKLLWPNGAVSLVFTADEPERLRGKQHTKLWADEFAAWRYPEAWDQAKFGLRLGDNPQGIITTTPKPTKAVRELMADPNTVTTKGSTYDNAANLAPTFLSAIVRKYEGTRLGRQELEAALLEDNPNALWQRQMIEDLRVTRAPDLKRVVVAVDPAAGDGEGGAEAGIIVAGVGQDGQGYVLDDRTVRGSPDAWAKAAVTAYHTFKADRLVAETNNGGKMIESLIRTVDPNVAYKELHASRGKAARAEPVAALYEQSRVHHVGAFPDLEDQLCLAGETLIACEHGPKRIDEIRAGDKVHTSRGLRRVTRAGCTNESAAVLRITTEEGRRLLTTAGHPVYNKSKQAFVPAASLKRGDTLEVLLCREAGDGAQKALTAPQEKSASTARRLNGADGFGEWIAPAITVTLAANSCIALYGKRLTAQSRRRMKSTTETKTKPTTLSTICNSSRAQSTRQFSIAGLPCQRLNSDPNGCARTGRKSSPANISVPVATRLSKAPAPAPGSVLPDAVKECEALSLRIPVYNITVEDAHEYYANGIRVHNCEWTPGDESPDRLDAMVWGLTELMLQPQTKRGAFSF